MSDYKGQLYVRSLPPDNDITGDDLHSVLWAANLDNVSGALSQYEEVEIRDGQDALPGAQSGITTQAIQYVLNNNDNTLDRWISDESDEDGGKQGVGRVNANDGTNSLQLFAQGNSVANEGIGGRAGASPILMGYYTSDPSTNNAVSNQEAVRILCDSEGRQIVKLSDVEAESIPVNDYKTFVDLAAAASNTHTYTVDIDGNAGKTKFALTSVQATSLAQIKVEIQVNNNTKFVLFNSPANPVCQTPPNLLEFVPDTQDIDVIITNIDHTKSDVYSTISGKYME